MQYDFANHSDNDLCELLEFVNTYDSRPNSRIRTAIMIELDRRVHAIAPQNIWVVQL